MSTYDPDLWLETLTRALSAFCEASLADPDATVEFSFPDTSRWTKETPLPRALVHFEIDDIQNPTLGFGTPGDMTVDDTSDPATVTYREAMQHLVNIDVGVMVSAQAGGATKRMELTRKLIDMFGSATGKQAFNDATGGLWPVSIDRGQFIVDHVNDIPLWRTVGMTLVIRAFSRYTGAPIVQIQDFDAGGELVIEDNDSLTIVTTP